MSNLTPIYAHDLEMFNDALAEFRFLLRRDTQAAIPDWLKEQAPLVAEQRALVATGKLRPCAPPPVTLKVVFVDEGGSGQGRLGELRMERIMDSNATGELYPAVTMAGVRTDAAWRGAMEAAREYAKECSFGIVPGADVRWSVLVLNPGENFDEHTPRPLKSGERLIGSSAGVAFFLGLFALAQTDGARALDARKVVEYMIALATFPEAESRKPEDHLGTLGGTERIKLAALKSLPEGTPVVVVFPRDYPESILIRHKPLPIDTIGELAAKLRQRCAPTIWPDFLPHSCRATRYIGGRNEVESLTESLRGSRLHVVSGPGGVGKTARVVEAAEELWQAGVFPGGRFFVNLYGASEPGRKVGEVIAVACKEKPAEKIDDIRIQTSRLLAMNPSIVLLEGAETVAERDIAALLDWFTGSTTVVWMTRREPDARHRSLRSAKHHSVRELSPADALECLCYASERKVEELSATERVDMEEIAKAAEYLPLLLGWAGAALQPDRDTTPAKYLAELNNPLEGIADPDDPEQNAGRFLRRSLARIVATAEMTDLPAVAKQIFASLAAFHPSYGAPPFWLASAAGLDASQPKGRKRLTAARRALLGLGLVIAQSHGRFEDAGRETLHAVHALARVIAIDLWREQSSAQRKTAIFKLLDMLTKALSLPERSSQNSDSSDLTNSVAGLVHCGHWMVELTDVDSSLTTLVDKWLALICEEVKIKGDDSLDSGDLLSAEEAFRGALEIAKMRTEWFPDNLDIQAELASLCICLGNTHAEREDWTNAKNAFEKALGICRQLVETEPDTLDFRSRLAMSHERLANVAIGCGDDETAEQAFRESMHASEEAIAKTRCLIAGDVLILGNYPVLRSPILNILMETTFGLALFLQRRNRGEEAIELARRGLLGTDHLANLLEKEGSVLTERQRLITVELEELARSDSGPEQ